MNMTNAAIIDELTITLANSGSSGDREAINAAIKRIRQYDAYTAELLTVCKEFSDQLAADLEKL